MLRERRKRGEERAGAVCEPHGEGNLASVGRKPRSRLAFRKQEHEAGEILGVVLDAFSKNHALIMIGGAAPRDGGGRFVSASKHLTDAAGGVLGGKEPHLPVGGKKTVAISQ